MLSGNRIEMEVKEMAHFLWVSRFVYSTSLYTEENMCEREQCTVRNVWTDSGGQHQEGELSVERRCFNCTG